MTDWIEHDGSGMPVPGDTLVYTQHRDGCTCDCGLSADFWNDEPSWWEHTGSYDDIVAYKVVKE